jgi:hypothetical protein
MTGGERATPPPCMGSRRFRAGSVCHADRRGRSRWAPIGPQQLRDVAGGVARGSDLLVPTLVADPGELRARRPLARPRLRPGSILCGPGGNLGQKTYKSLKFQAFKNNRVR